MSVVSADPNMSPVSISWNTHHSALVLSLVIQLDVIDNAMDLCTIRENTMTALSYSSWCARARRSLKGRQGASLRTGSETQHVHF